jgi:DNA-binding response OmpR family regulator
MSGRAEEFIPSPERTVVALAVSPLPTDRARLREILSQANWKLHEASDCCGALALLRGQRVPVLLCERDHADGNWEDLLKATSRLPAPPNLVVFSRLADESLWAKVLNLGGFDVLMTPFEPEEVLRVTFAAWSRWECDFGASTAKEATRNGRPAARQVGSAGRGLAPGGTGDTNAIISGGGERFA